MKRSNYLLLLAAMAVCGAPMVFGSDAGSSSADSSGSAADGADAGVRVNMGKDGEETRSFGDRSTMDGASWLHKGVPAPFYPSYYSVDSDWAQEAYSGTARTGRTNAAWDRKAKKNGAKELSDYVNTPEYKAADKKRQTELYQGKLHEVAVKHPLDSAEFSTAANAVPWYDNAKFRAYGRRPLATGLGLGGLGAVAANIASGEDQIIKAIEKLFKSKRGLSKKKWLRALMAAAELGLLDALTTGLSGRNSWTMNGYRGVKDLGSKAWNYVRTPKENKGYSLNVGDGASTGSEPKK